MKKWLSLLMIAVLLAGCSPKEEVTVESTDRTVRVSSDRDGGVVKIESSDGSAALQTKGGEVSVTTTDESGKTKTVSAGRVVDPSELGVKLYPGSTSANEGGSDSRMDSGGEALLIVVRETTDSPEQVMEFYKKELKSPDSYATAEMAAVSGTNDHGHSVVVSAVRERGATKTQITISVSKKRQ